jgi:integrase/recombinase XerD
MIEDMTIRKLAPKTQASYIRAVRDFSIFLGRSPDQASAEDLRRYQLHLASSGVSIPNQNIRVTALRFFFSVTLGRGEITGRMPFVREPRKLPVVMSPEEIARLLAATPGLKHRATRPPRMCCQWHLNRRQLPYGGIVEPNARGFVKTAPKPW